MAFGIGSPGMTGAIAGGPQALQLAYLRDPRLALAAQLQQTGADSSPVQSPWQGAARLAQALMGGYQANRVRGEYEKQAEEYANERRDLYAPVQELRPGADGRTGPTNTASVTTRPATPEEMLARAQNLRSPFLQDDVRQIQTMAMQDAQRRADPMFGRVAVRGVGLVDMRGGQPQVVVPEQRAQTPQQRFMNVGGVLLDISGDKPTVAYRAPEPPQAPQAPQMPFGGTSIESQHYNNLLTLPQNDPRYAVSFNALFGRRAVTQADGTTVEIQPPIPQGIQPPSIGQPAQPPQAAPSPVVPGGAAAPPQGAAPNVSTVQTPGGATVTRIGSPREKDLSEAQARANLFGGQMREAEDILATTRVPSSAAIMAWRNLPESAVNLALSRNDQQYFNALRLFAAGVLRKETGAAFTPNELLDVQSRYFPMPGDDPKVIEQKARSRRQVQESIRAEMPGGNFRGLLPEDEARSQAARPGQGGAPPPPPGFDLVTPR